MGSHCALVISDDAERREFLSYCLMSLGLESVWYPNIVGAIEATRLDFFYMVVVDISLPIEPKLISVKNTCRYQPNTQIITIGKIQYLKKINFRSFFPSVVSIESLGLFPDQLEIYSKEGYWC